MAKRAISLVQSSSGIKEYHCLHRSRNVMLLYVTGQFSHNCQNLSEHALIARLWPFRGVSGGSRGIVHEAVVSPYPSMTCPGHVWPAQRHLLTGNSYELCASRAAGWPGGQPGTQMTSGMTRALESQTGTQPATPRPSKRAVAHVY